MQNEILEKLGLSPVESKIYLMLLDNGSSLAGTISKKSGINRTLVYDAVERLIKKGLVSFIIKANRKYFEAESPNVLFNNIREKESELDQIKKEIPNLIQRHKLVKSSQEANIYLGQKGIKSIFEDILKQKKDYVLFGAEGKFKEILPYYYGHYQKRKEKLGIKVRAIFNEEARSKEAIRELVGKVRFIPKHYSSPSTTWIYGDKVSIVMWTKEPIGILIKSKEMAEGYRHYFELMWGIAKD